MLSIEFDLLQTLALATVVFYTGVKLRQRIEFLDRLNIPSAVVGGLVFAALVFALRARVVNLSLDASAQPVLNVAFFTTIGMGASVALLRKGGAAVVLFLLFSIFACVVQNLIGIGIATAFGESPLLGLMAGSVTLVGGPATGLAFAPLFEEAGLAGAGVVAITSAVFGIVCSGLTGNPVGTALIVRHGLSPQLPAAPAIAEGQAAPVQSAVRHLLVEVEREDTGIVRNLAILALAMGLGSVLSGYIEGSGLTLPAYIGAMIVASALRNLDEATGWLGIDEDSMEWVGGVALNIFLVVALMNLELWQLASQAVPLIAILLAQLVALVLLAYFVSYRLMGRDYDSAVMASGFIGFAMGTTANAVVNMRALVARFGAAPRAFLVIPLVGAFFIDFANALIVTGFINWVIGS